MSKPGDIANLVLRETYKNKSKPLSHKSSPITSLIDLRSKLIKARRFVFDDVVSSFLGDLAMAAFSKGKDEVKVMESLRFNARLPFPFIWIEYNHSMALNRLKFIVTKNNRTDSEVSIPEEGLFNHGLLLERHPEIETAIKCTVFSVIDGTPEVLPVTMFWSCVNEEIPWNGVDTNLSDIITGIANYRDVPYVGVSWRKDYPFDMKNLWGRRIPHIVEMAATQIKMYILLVATLADVPISSKRVSPSGRFIGGGRDRDYIEYDTVTLKLPAKSTIEMMAKRLIVKQTKRRHDVRGFWRTYHRGEDVLCHRTMHDWVASDSLHLHCSKCESFKTWVPEHKRGGDEGERTHKKHYLVERNY